MSTAPNWAAAAALENDDLSKLAATNVEFLRSPRRLLIDGAWLEARSGSREQK